MGSFDTITWQALTVLLTVAGLAGTVWFWRRRGPVAGLRMLAVSLLPAAAYLTGTLRMLWEIGDAVTRWAARLVFSPAVWLGFGLALVSLVLLVVAGLLRRRRGAGASSSATSRGALPGTRSRPEASTPGTSSSATGEDDDDLADIEAILKRHGIS